MATSDSNRPIVKKLSRGAYVVLAACGAEVVIPADLDEDVIIEEHENRCDACGEIFEDADDEEDEAEDEADPEEKLRRSLTELLDSEDNDSGITVDSEDLSGYLTRDVGFVVSQGDRRFIITIQEARR